MQWKVPLIVEVYLLTKVIVSAWQEPLYAFYLSVFYPNAQISLLTLTYIFSFFLFILLCNGHIERNPGPQKLKQNSPSICHWNLSSLSANNFSKHTQLKAYNSVYKHHFICLSETYLDSATPKNLLEIEGYNLIRADHLNNVKRGEVCIHIQKIALLSLILFSQISQTCPLIMEFMLHPDCHHQVVHASFNVWYGITKRLIHPILEKPPDFLMIRILMHK